MSQPGDVWSYRASFPLSIFWDLEEKGTICMADKNKLTRNGTIFIYGALKDKQDEKLQNPLRRRNKRGAQKYPPPP